MNPDPACCRQGCRRDSRDLCGVRRGAQGRRYHRRYAPARCEILCSRTRRQNRGADRLVEGEGRPRLPPEGRFTIHLKKGRMICNYGAESCFLNKILRSNCQIVGCIQKIDENVWDVGAANDMEEEEAKLDKWLGDLDFQGENELFKHTGQTRLGHALYVLRHTLDRHGEMNYILYQSGHKNVNWH